MLAASRGSSDIFYKLVQVGADPCLRMECFPKRGPYFARTVLHYAAASRNDSIEIVAFILEKCNDGHLVNYYNCRGQTALHIASNGNNKKICEQLVQTNIEIDSVDYYSNRTALWYAALNGHYQIVELLLNKNSNPNHQDRFGNSVLHSAIQSGNLNIFKSILNHSADISLTDAWGQTAFMKVAYAGTAEMFDALIKHETSSIRFADNYDHFSLIQYAIRSQNNSEHKVRKLFQLIEYSEMSKFGLKKNLLPNSDILLNVISRHGTASMLEFILTKYNHSFINPKPLHNAVLSEVDQNLKVFDYDQNLYCVCSQCLVSKFGP